jgi:3-dehydroquinate synthase
MRDVRVELDQDSYDILIGKDDIIQKLEEFVRGAGFSAKALLVSDTNTGRLYGTKVLAALHRAGLSAELYMFAAGENSKSLPEAEKIYTRAIELGLDRKSAVFTLGGGVVGDMAGFVAATYMRGIPFIQVPTSLLAQVDSSVGGKVAVNHRLGKNLIGAFYQPRAVFMDLDMLQSLPKREIYTGLGEIIKYGVIYDEVFFAYLENHVQDILKLADEALEHIVARSCEIKAAVVSKDEKEQGLRRILNFGHTMAHAIEKETGYVRYNHGEAVAIGMVGAAYISRELGFADAASVGRLEHLIRAMHLPIKADGCTVEGMYHDIFHDKKTIDGRVNWVLMQGIGKTAMYDHVPEDVVKRCMEACINQ